MSTFGILMEYTTGLYLRPATAEEAAKSKEAVKLGYPRGAFSGDEGKLVYVEEPSDDSVVFDDNENWAHDGNGQKGGQ